MATDVTYVHDLAISAVSYDALLVDELVALLAARLRRPPVWATASAPNLSAESPLQREVSRVGLVLHQRLWGHDDGTAIDAAILKERSHKKPKSVVVISLDDEPVPSWMAGLRHCDLTTVGLDGVVELALAAIAGAGGSVGSSQTAKSGVAAEPAPRWPEPPVPFLGQPRAQSALRRELDAICSELEPRFDAEKANGGDAIFELHKGPNRIVARLHDVGVSFSWVAGRAGTVADGRLMVIEWSGMDTRRGLGALRTAHAVRECVYTAQAGGTDAWCWRADVPHGRASSTANLVGEWLACASRTSQALATAGDR